MLVNNLMKIFFNLLVIFNKALSSPYSKDNILIIC